jgi:UDP-N-acetylmuramate--alanine ligase
MKTYFLCGVGGSGMTPLAQLLLQKGHRVFGSDRSRDQGKLPEKFAALEKTGVTLFPQDGSGITSQVDCLVVSSAVEPTIPDVKAALSLNIEIKKRAEILAGLFNQQKGIAIGGTSGKTTVTAMMGYVLSALGEDPTIINGGLMANFDNQAAVVGQSECFVSEVDESDGSILYFEPYIGLLNNIALDHKPMDELIDIFQNYLKNCRHGVVVNADNVEAMQALEKSAVSNALTFSVKNPGADVVAREINLTPTGASFTLIYQGKSHACQLNVPGLHNVSNALAVIALSIYLELDISRVCKALAGFKGTKRRLEIVGQAHGITVIDDFAHNPDKVAASLKALQVGQGRLLMFFQPHGFKPMYMMRQEITDAFAGNMKADDIIIMPEIYYAGGTVERLISSNDLIEDIKAKGGKGYFFQTREDCGAYLLSEAKEGDRIVIMGARDDTLTVFAQNILNDLAGYVKQSA